MYHPVVTLKFRNFTYFRERCISPPSVQQPLPHGTLMPDLPPSDPRKRKLPLPAFAAAAKAKAATTASSAKTAPVAPAKSAASLAAAAASASAAIVSTAATAGASVLPKKRVDPRLTHRKLKIEARDTLSTLYVIDITRNCYGF